MKDEIMIGEACILEGMTSLSALFDAIETGVNDRIVYEIYFDRAKKAKKARELAFLAKKCEQLSIPLTLCEADLIDSLANGSSHGGVVARCGARTLPAASAQNLPQGGFLCLLDGIEDPYNFGYALRSLYAAGCDGILLGERNWLSAAGIVAKSSAGASEILPAWVGKPEEAVIEAKKAGYRVICAGIRNSVSLYEANLKKPVLLIVGGEKRGISASLLTLADETVRIDYGRAFRGSLSTASATAVMAFEILHHNPS